MTREERFSSQVAERFWARVQKTETCWLWTGPTSNGYGSVYVAPRNERVHRVSLILSGVEIPDGLVVDHLCRVTNCVRPDHLEVVDQRTNVLRGIGPTAKNAARAVCIRGHELTSRRQRRRYGMTEVRRCLQCQRDDRAKPRVCVECGVQKSTNWYAGPTCRKCQSKADVIAKRAARAAQAAEMERLRSELSKVSADRDELSGWINALLSENSRYIRALSAIVAQTEYGPMLTDSVIQQARAALKEAK